MRDSELAEQLKTMPDGELRATRRDLQAGLGLMRPASPMYAPASAYMDAVTAELARLLPGAQDPHLGGVHDADEEPGISGGVVGKVPGYVGEVPDSRQIFGGGCCVRAGGSRERRGRLSLPGPWSAAGRGSAR